MSEKQMSAEINRLGALVGDLQRENRELRAELEKLREQLAAASK